ncbi:MAG TPA: phosphoglycerate kinase [Deltaproteobacteria bacterium]|nr:phosphoglycerate kinase [Deltaproteobacteria bacterium]
MKSIDQLDINGKKVLIRVDFNVPTDDQGNITDDTRIRAHLETIRYATDKGGKVVLISHLGRPKGKRNEKYTLRPVAKRLSELLGKTIPFSDDCVGEPAEKAVAALKAGDVVLLENLRFHAEEEKNDPGFAEQLAALGDVYIDDAFAAAHRGHASNAGITAFIKECAVGILLKNELDYLRKATVNPERPLVAIIGGAKVSDKIGVLKNLVEKVDAMLIGGGMAFTFIKAQGYEVGKSLCEVDMLDTAREIMEKAKQKGVKLLLPVDCIIAERAEIDALAKEASVQAIPSDWAALDIGPKSSALFAEALAGAKTIVWNGPMGLFELEPFSKGTTALARAVADSPATSIIGGGDTDTAVHQAGVSDRISYISTGGGAFLELLEGRSMPAIEALESCGGAQ